MRAYHGRAVGNIAAGAEHCFVWSGDEGAQILHYFGKDSRFIGFCSNNESKQANGYRGYPVMSPETLLKKRDLTVFVAAPRAKKEIMWVLKNPEDILRSRFLIWIQLLRPRIQSSILDRILSHIHI